MSADNYYWITKRGDKWIAVMRFMSDESPVDARAEHAAFECDSLLETIGRAQREYTEYGVHIDDSLCLPDVEALTS